MLALSALGFFRADLTLAGPAVSPPCSTGEAASSGLRPLAPGDPLPKRAAGRPGDLLLWNAAARAVVRRNDGVLVDFFRTPLEAATSPQLAAERYLDGLTLFRPFIQAGARRFELRSAPQVQGTRLEATEDLSVAGAQLRVTTSYALHGGEPRLDITTRVEHLGGHELETLNAGERVRWGNSDYFIDGRRGRPSYSGWAFEVGRKGAGGDLVLFPAEGKMVLNYSSTQPGLMGELSTTYGSFPLKKGGVKLVRRSLAYRSLAEAPRAQGTALLEVSLIDERDVPLAGKLSFRGLGGTPDPDFGNDGDERGANRFVYTGNGRIRRPLFPGRYRVIASSGIERDVSTFDVTLASGETASRTARLPRVIETPGVLHADLHLHQARSPDADIADRTRVISIAAEGLEFAVASDHYTVGDLAPALAELTRSGELTRRLIVMRGSELTTTGHDFGHFNVFPVDSVEGIPFENTTPKALFGAVRELAPASLLQVNHPRWPKSYFARYALDPARAVVRPEFRSEFSDDYDVLEVFNGFDAWSQALVRNVLRDYLKLVARGKRYTATGNSDSHGLFFVDPGMPRNLVRYGAAGNDDADLDADPVSVIDAIRRGQVLVTNGPIIDVAIDGVGPGGTLKTGSKPVTLQLQVRAAPWIDVTDVEVLRGGGERIRSIPVRATQEVTRLTYRTTLNGDGSTFFIVIARGKKPLPNVYRPGVRPFAFTNPVFIEP